MSDKELVMKINVPSRNQVCVVHETWTIKIFTFTEMRIDDCLHLQTPFKHIVVRSTWAPPGSRDNMNMMSKKCITCINEFFPSI